MPHDYDFAIPLVVQKQPKSFWTAPGSTYGIMTSVPLSQYWRIESIWIHSSAGSSYTFGFGVMQKGYVAAGGTINDTVLQLYSATVVPSLETLVHNDLMVLPPGTDIIGIQAPVAGSSAALGLVIAIFGFAYRLAGG